MTGVDRDRPPRPPLREDSRRTHEAILTGALDLLAERPHASLEQIARAIGVNRSTVHRHFASRDDLLEALSVRVIAEVDEIHVRCRAQGGPAAEQIARILRANALLGKRFRFFLDRWSPILGRPDVYASDASWVELLRRAQADGVFRSDCSIAWMRRVTAAVMRAAYEAIDEEELPLEEAADLTVTTIMAALAYQPSRERV